MSAGSRPWYISPTVVSGIFRFEPLISIAKCFKRLSSEQVHVRIWPSGETTPIFSPRTMLLTNFFIACWILDVPRCRAGMLLSMNSLATLLDVVPILLAEALELHTLAVSASSVSISFPLVGLACRELPLLAAADEAACGGNGNGCGLPAGSFGAVFGFPSGPFPLLDAAAASSSPTASTRGPRADAWSFSTSAFFEALQQQAVKLQLIASGAQRRWPWPNAHCPRARPRARGAGARRRQLGVQLSRAMRVER